MRNKLLDMCGHVVLGEEHDQVKWFLTTFAMFSAKSLYQLLLGE